MNPLPLIVGELRHNALGCAAVVALIAVAVALGSALSAQGRALRLASTPFGDGFDLVVESAATPRNRAVRVRPETLWEMRVGPSPDVFGEASMPALSGVGPPWAAGEVQPAPAPVLLAPAVDDAHLLAQPYRDRTTKASFPAEAQPRPGAVPGNVHDMLRSLTLAFDGLLVTAVLLMIVAVLSGRRQSIGALRALGAPPAFIFITVWLQGVLLIGAGVLLGIGLGFPLAGAIGAIAGDELGHAVDAAIGVPEVAFAAVLLGAGSLFAAAPSLPLLRVPAARLLRSD